MAETKNSTATDGSVQPSFNAEEWKAKIKDMFTKASESEIERELEKTESSKPNAERMRLAMQSICRAPQVSDMTWEEQAEIETLIEETVDEAMKDAGY